MVYKQNPLAVRNYALQEPIWTRIAQTYRYALASTRHSPEGAVLDDLTATEKLKADPTTTQSRNDACQDILAHTQRLIEDHRKHLVALEQTGWFHLHKEENWYRTMNCPPVGVVLQNYKRQQACHWRSFCPWCWCRNTVRETYLNVEYAIFGGNNKQPYKSSRKQKEYNLPQGPWHLLVLERDYGAYPLDLLPEMWGHIHATRPLTPLFLQQELGNVHGLYYLYVVYPGDPRTGDAAHFIVKKRVLALVNKSFSWDVGESRVEQCLATGRYAGMMTCRKRCRKMTRTAIIGAVGMACSYPRQLLYGPADLLHLLLEQKRRRLIPAAERTMRAEAEREAEMRKEPAERRPEILYSAPRTYERGSGIRLSASLGLFRDRMRRKRL